MMAQGPVSAFESDLLSLRARLAELGGLAEDQLRKALDAMRRRDGGVAAEVVAEDVRLDMIVAEIEEHALRTLAFRQPLAQDLREIVSIMRIATTLERVGDLAKNIARRSELAPQFAPQRIERSVNQLGAMVQRQLSAALDAFGAQDVSGAVDLRNRDVEIDELFHSLFRDLLTHMTQDPQLVEVGAQIMFSAKNLERIGDHTTFIAEMTYYVSIGQPLTDDRPKGRAMYEKS